MFDFYQRVKSLILDMACFRVEVHKQNFRHLFHSVAILFKVGTYLGTPVTPTKLWECFKIINHSVSVQNGIMENIRPCPVKKCLHWPAFGVEILDISA